jgi:hypothetical protein
MFTVIWKPLCRADNSQLNGGEVVIGRNIDAGLYPMRSNHVVNENIVTDLINALPGNSSVNTVQNATIEEAVFSVSEVTSRSGGWWSRDYVFSVLHVRSSAI